jgi:nicotinamide mononucleotide adenylyltransferase
MEIKTTPTPVIVGRFQAPYLHLGHIYLIATALQEYEKRVLIILGESLQRDERNPYTPLQRADMIHKVFNEKRIIISQMWDCPGDDIMWSQGIDKILDEYRDPVLLHSRDSFVSHYHGIHDTREIPELPGYSATQIRNELKNK